MKRTPAPHLTRREALLGLLASATQIAACGGGGTNVAGLSSGGTGTFTTGTVTGYGSIIVNGIRFNNDSATILSSNGAALSSSDIGLGMVVSVEASPLTAAPTAGGLPTATAYRIVCGSEWVGPVANISATQTARSFEVLGHTVEVLATTIFAGAVSRFADLRTSHYVEIHGYVDLSKGQIKASRVQVYTTSPSYYQLSGALTNIDRSKRTALLGSTPLAWEQDSLLPATLVSGSFVRISLQPQPRKGNWLIRSLSLLQTPPSLQSKDYEAEIHGTITAYESAASFTVAGLRVNAQSARISGSLALGALVEVHGDIRQGVLYATQVEVEDSAKVEAQLFEFYGAMSALTSTTFVVKGQTFTYDSNTKDANLLAQAAGRVLEVKALRRDGFWYAVEVELED